MRAAPTCMGILILVVAAAGACGRSEQTPAQVVQTLFEKVRSEEIEEARGLISSGQLDDYDTRFLVELLGAGDVQGVEASVVRQEGDRATVALILVTDAGRLPGRVPLAMVRQDGDWKVEYFGWSWPTALKSANFR